MNFHINIPTNVYNHCLDSLCRGQKCFRFEHLTLPDAYAYIGSVENSINSLLEEGYLETPLVIYCKVI